MTLEAQTRPLELPQIKAVSRIVTHKQPAVTIQVPQRILTRNDYVVLVPAACNGNGGKRQQYSGDGSNHDHSQLHHASLAREGGK